MTSAAATAPARSLSAAAVGRIWARHLLSFYIPVNSLAFLLTGPHRWWVALLFVAPMVVAFQLDRSTRVERRQPAEDLPAWPFDALVYALAALQFWIVVGTVQLFTVQGVFSMDMAMTFLVVGGSSGFSIITAHELIHRKSRLEQGLGRLMLCTVLYEHFYTEHLRGHHVRVGTPEDPATARFGEGYEAFFRRTVPAQLRSAWRLEKRRLGDPDMPLLDRRMLRNRILHGLVLEWGLAASVLAFFGLASFVAFLAQAVMAVRLLEAVNYFEHWGLQRRGRRVQPEDSWDTHSWFTYYGLVGLSRHADHHAWPARPYQALRVFDEAPLLPWGYVVLTDLVMARNAEFQRIAAAELGRRRLGPFRTEPEAPHAVQPVDAEAALRRLSEAQAEERGRASRGSAAALARRVRTGAARTWRAIPPVARGLAVVAVILGVTALGAHWESGDGPGLGTRLLHHGWILGVVVGIVAARSRLEPRLGEPLSWVAAFAALAVVGLGSGSLLF